MLDDQTYPVVEIFQSLQGEGYNTGKEVVFLRFGRCNLYCPWCDTDFATHESLGIDAVVARVAEFRSKALILTGGEPFIQEGLEDLLSKFKDLGYWIGAETNGLVAPPQECLRKIDYLSVSPKALYAFLYEDERMVTRADEVRVVVDGDVRSFCEEMRNRIEALHYFLSPCEREGMINIEETVRLLGELNRGRRQGKWLLSLQTHKLAGFR
ncbi:MAG TPA: 7-carboxy-7-deazaguanine synthase QueE [Kiritimatiellia bacterium]|nr:7-carboxy-7-deazaguanine synthase QueE [Kiritimatiellia bacterium]HPS06029.1 7-carboxy-7-deazaguanine synthase QueE [Kiritimatiellia bacterium]